MAWLWDVLKTISGNTTANQKLIIDGFKELAEARRIDAEDRRQEAEQRRLEAEENKAQVSQLMQQVQQLTANEEKCQQMLIRNNEELRNLREELIFTRKMKP